jgi:Tol biopolymer transport system component
VLALVAATALVRGQTQAPSGGFTLERVLDYPFPDNLVASPKGSTIGWTFNERGARNIYAADGPAFQARRVTSYSGDEGQELTNLSFSADGKTIVYVRGGDHGADWPADGGLQPNPNASTAQPRMRVFAIPTAGDAPPSCWARGARRRFHPRAIASPT